MNLISTITSQRFCPDETIIAVILPVSLEVNMQEEFWI